jgi:hypothetical protein
MPFVEHVDGLLVLLAVGGAGGLVRAQGPLDVRRQLGSQPIGGSRPQLHGRRRVGDHQPAQARRPAHGVLGGQHAAPRLPEQRVAVGDAQRLHQIVQLRQEELNRPEVGCRVRQMRGPAVAELVVVHDGPVTGQRRQPEQVVVRAAGAAVQHDQWHPT